MEAQLYGVGKLFQPQARLVIPIYQRPYVWEEDRQWAPLWDDISRLAEQLLSCQSPKPHFLGAVVIDAHPGPDRYGKIKRHLVIDGQQRLTTIQLLLEALADNYDRLCEEDCTEAKRFADLSRLLTRNQYVGADDEDAEYKVWPMNLDQAAFRAVMNAGSPGQLSESTAAEPNVRNGRIAQAYGYFYDRIREWLLKQSTLAGAVQAFYEVVDQYLQLVVIDLKNTVDPQLIFETLNARGTPLLASDLIKNFLFHEAAAETGDGDHAYAQYWMPFEAEHGYWNETIGKGAQRRVRLNVFMHQYLTMQKRDDVLVNNLYHEYRRFSEATDLSVVDQLAELRRYGDIYRGIDLLPKGSPEAVFISRLRQMDVATIMPFVLRLMGDGAIDPADRARIMEYLESYLVRRLVCHLPGKSYNLNFVNLLRATNEKGISPELVCELLLGWDKDTNVWPDDGMFHTAWMSYGAYNWLAQARVRMILEALEPALSSVKAEDIDVNETLTIEHLMPQNWRANYPLPSDGSVTEVTRDGVLHTFGNLTLLNNRLNPSVSNGAWINLVSETVDGQAVQVDRGKRAEILRHTRLTLNNMLLDYPTWDEESIRSRGERLYKAALEVWPRPKSQSIHIVIESEPAEGILDSGTVAQDEDTVEVVVSENDSVALVPVLGELPGEGPDAEKTLIYCPAIASDTLLYYVRQADSYSLRPYGGRLGADGAGKHAEGAHASGDFERMYRPDRWLQVAQIETPPERLDRWERLVAEQWDAYRTARLST